MRDVNVYDIDFDLLSSMPEEYLGDCADEKIIKNYKIYRDFLANKKEYNLKKYSAEISTYYAIMKEAKNFLKDIGIKKDAFEYSGALSYLVWNGYFSNNKNFTFKDYELEELSGFEGMNVIYGEGCCRNITRFFKDSFDEKKIPSNIILNNIYFDGSEFFDLDIKRNSTNGPLEKASFGETYVDDNEEIANHSCILFKHNKKYFVYDPTNINIYAMNGTKGKLVLGDGYIQTHPYSLMTLGDLEDYEMEYIVSDMSNAKVSYRSNDKALNKIINGCELLQENSDLCSDFHDTIKPKIKRLSNFHDELVERNRY